MGKKVVYLVHFENGSFLWQVCLKNYKEKKHISKYVSGIYTHNKCNCIEKQIPPSFLHQAVWRIPAEYRRLLLSLDVTFVHSFRRTEKIMFLLFVVSQVEEYSFNNIINKSCILGDVTVSLTSTLESGEKWKYLPFAGYLLCKLFLNARLNSLRLTLVVPSIEALGRF